MGDALTVAARALDLLPHLEAKARERQVASQAKQGQKVGNVPEKVPAPDAGESRDKAAALTAPAIILRFAEGPRTVTIPQEDHANVRLS